jgi:hypothetical protein
VGVTAQHRPGDGPPAEPVNEAIYFTWKEFRLPPG